MCCFCCDRSKLGESGAGSHIQYHELDSETAEEAQRGADKDYYEKEELEPNG